MKPLVSASYAQFGVDAGDEDIGQLVMAYEKMTHYPWRPIIVENLYVATTDDFLQDWIEPVCGESYVQCSLSCVEILG